MARKTLTERQMLAQINRNVNHAFRLDGVMIILVEHQDEINKRIEKAPD